MLRVPAKTSPRQCCGFATETTYFVLLAAVATIAAACVVGLCVVNKIGRNNFFLLDVAQIFALSLCGITAIVAGAAIIPIIRHRQCWCSVFVFLAVLHLGYALAFAAALLWDLPVVLEKQIAFVKDGDFLLQSTETPIDSITTDGLVPFHVKEYFWTKMTNNFQMPPYSDRIATSTLLGLLLLLVVVFHYFFIRPIDFNPTHRCRDLLFRVLVLFFSIILTAEAFFAFIDLQVDSWVFGTNDGMYAMRQSRESLETTTMELIRPWSALASSTIGFIIAAHAISVLAVLPLLTRSYYKSLASHVVLFASFIGMCVLAVFVAPFWTKKAPKELPESAGATETPGVPAVESAVTMLTDLAKLREIIEVILFSIAALVTLILELANNFLAPSKLYEQQLAEMQHEHTALQDYELLAMRIEDKSMDDETIHFLKQGLDFRAFELREMLRRIQETERHLQIAIDATRASYEREPYEVQSFAEKRLLNELTRMEGILKSQNSLVKRLEDENQYLKTQATCLQRVDHFDRWNKDREIPQTSATTTKCKHATDQPVEAGVRIIFPKEEKHKDDEPASTESLETEAVNQTSIVS